MRVAARRRFGDARSAKHVIVAVLVIFGHYFNKGLFTQIANCGDILRPPPRVFITSHSISQCGELFALSQSVAWIPSSLSLSEAHILSSSAALHSCTAPLSPLSQWLYSSWPHMKNPHLPSSVVLPLPSVPHYRHPSAPIMYDAASQPTLPYLFPFSPPAPAPHCLCTVYTAADSR